MDAALFFNKDLTPRHVLGPPETSELETIAASVLQEIDTSTLSVPAFEDRTVREGLRNAIFSANSSLNLDHRIDSHYLPPHAYFDLGGTELREGKDHPLFVFQEMGLFKDKAILEYKLILGQLIESVERMAMKGYRIMGKESSAFDLFDVPKDTPDESAQVSQMKSTEHGRSLMEESGVSKYHSALGLLSKHLGWFSERIRAPFERSKAGLPKAWADYRHHLQQRSDEGFGRFMDDYRGDLERATECMKLAYSMTRQILSVVSDERSYQNISATADMALHPRRYQKAINAGVEHLKMVDQILAHYVVEKGVSH